MKALVYQVNPAGWGLCWVLKRAWRGCLFTRLNGLRLAEVPRPELPGEEWVRVRTLLGGICGTDLAILQQKAPANSILQAYSSQPMVLGHENVGVVEEAGSAVERSWAGRRVCVEPTLSCVVRGIEPACRSCRAGQFGACENFGAAGEGRWGLPAGTSIGYNRVTGGSYGEYFVAHASQLVAAPEGLSDEELVLTDPAACSLHAVLRSDWRGARQVLVYGSGAIGLTAAAGLRAVGYEGRIDLAGRGAAGAGWVKRLGVKWLALPGDAAGRFAAVAESTGGGEGRVRRSRFGNRMLDGGYDIVFECLGSRQSINEGLKWARARGQVVLLGTGHGGRVDLTPLWFRELTVVGAYGRQVEDWDGRRVGTYPLVHELMRAGKLDLRGLVTHRFRLEEHRRAWATAAAKGRRGALKVVFDFR